MNATSFDTLPAPARTRLFSLRGRLGRARYITYCIGSIVLAFLFMYLAGLMLVLSGGFGRMLYIVVSVLLFYCLLPLVFTVLTIKRSHDFNVGGWLALLLLVPVVNMVFWFIPGSRDENRYGPVPPPPSTGIKLAAVILPLLLFSVFLATGGPRMTERQNPASASPPATSIKPYTP